MASQGMSRKRPAPGASPLSYQQAQTMNNFGAPPSQLSNDQFLQWGQNPDTNATPPPYPDSPAYNPSTYGANQEVVATSNQVARRPASQLVPRGKSYNDAAPIQWIDPASGPGQSGDSAWSDDIEDLERRAQVAKKDSQAKRKQIPPFVQKLSSFLDESKNTDLIRWSDDGNSFIVLDEDEFAKTLIPELFKHNNYASFVRQLNMYGFHKKVGLSDNSMKASERKHKSPSEYSNPYFRRGHPDLLWLIQKPKNLPGQGTKGKGKVKSEAEANDEDFAEELVEEIPVGQSAQEVRPRPRGQLAISADEGALPRDQLANVHREIQNIRQQQQIISQMISRLRREHEQLYGQAANFQDQHTRHENSINAILTFLATVYNRSLQGHDGAQGIANMFAGAIPHDQTQGNVVDVGDFAFDSLNGGDSSLQKSFKKQPLLLGAPPNSGTNGHPGRASTVSPSGAGSPYEGRQTRRMSQAMKHNNQLQPGAVEEVFDSTGSTNPPTPAAQQGQPSQSRVPQRDIMSLIQNTNARNSHPGTPVSDFPTVLTSLENSGGNSPLTPSQRADMLRLIANEANSSNPGSSNNALTSPNPPSMPPNYTARLENSRNEFESLSKLQAQQDQSVQNLTNLLQPLSPSGSIPGLGDGTNVPPSHLDLDQFFNSNDYFTDFPAQSEFDVGNNANGAANLNFDNMNSNDDELFGNLNDIPNGQQGPGFEPDEVDGGRVESIGSSEATSPANTADEGRQTLGAGRRASHTGPTKRRRKNE